MELWFLGTGAGRPVKDRNVTSIALRMPEDRGTFWLFDSGEGSQHQLMKTPLKLSRLEHIFITHMHGDHTFGLPGILCSRAFLGGTEPLKLFGPKGLKEWVELTLGMTASHLSYEIEYYEVTEGKVFEDDSFIVEAAPMQHRVECYGYRIVEKPRCGRLKVELLREWGVTPGPDYGKLKQGGSLTLPDGRLVRSKDVTEPPLPGRIIAILGDTSPCPAVGVLAKDADVLVHEATFVAAMTDKAVEYGHSTTHQAAQAARDAGVRQLVLTHFSTRYNDEEVQYCASEAAEIHTPVLAPRDLTMLPVHRRELMGDTRYKEV
ncbi:ribonuclease Z [Paenibacillus sp. 1P07SE]|uniref:ribonuclease Z n=1 Tax=Paenibacillus sp. 1P07SE TaxID=3132209 RepID=UPI0039A63A3D